jgi:hypothetical protein
MIKDYGIGSNYLRSLAEKTGGRIYRADDLAEVQKFSRPSPTNSAGSTVSATTPKARFRLARNETLK